MTRPILSAHFRAAEFDCHNGQKWPPEAHKALQLWCERFGEPLRKRFGPVTVTSGYRPGRYNASVGGAPLSFHRYELRYGVGKDPRQGVGVACDVKCASGDPALWTRYMMTTPGWARLGSEGRGAAVPYPGSGFAHFDTGPRRSWAG